MNADEAVNLVDAILGLQVVSGLMPAWIRPNYIGAQIDINGYKKIGLEEVLYIIQTVAGIRQNRRFSNTDWPDWANQRANPGSRPQAEKP